MATRPAPPDDEAPLDADTVDRLLSSLGTDMVLVGGQALAFWMDRFGIGAGEMVVTSDGDALGSAAAAHRMARLLTARLLEPRPESATSLVAQLRIPAAGGKVANIDIVHMLYTVGGLRKSSEFTAAVVDNSIEVEWSAGKFIRVMDPLDVLASRAQNAAGLLSQKGPHVLTQARWAIEVAKSALLKVAARGDPADDRLGRKLQGVVTLAESRVGRMLLRDHAIDVLDAIDVEAIRQAAPVHDRQLRKIEALIAARKARTSEPPEGGRPR